VFWKLCGLEEFGDLELGKRHGEGKYDNFRIELKNLEVKRD
jgi:hypothetical protein